MHFLVYFQLSFLGKQSFWYDVMIITHIILQRHVSPSRTVIARGNHKLSYVVHNTYIKFTIYHKTWATITYT